MLLGRPRGPRARTLIPQAARLTVRIYSDREMDAGGAGVYKESKEKQALLGTDETM